MSLGLEPPSVVRAAGILVAFAGCAIMVALSAEAAPNGLAREIAGNVFFFVNCLATALYVILSKDMLRVYPPLCVTAWSYLTAACFMVLTTVTVNNASEAVNFLCPDCHGAWHVPVETLWALAYWIVFQSCVSYALLTWGNKFATRTLSMSYSVLQPVTATLLTALIVFPGLYPSCKSVDDDTEGCLQPPGLGDLGAVGVFFGLFLVLRTEPSMGKKNDDVAGHPLDTSVDGLLTGEVASASFDGALYEDAESGETGSIVEA